MKTEYKKRLLVFIGFNICFNKYYSAKKEKEEIRSSSNSNKASSKIKRKNNKTIRDTASSFKKMFEESFLLDIKKNNSFEELCKLLKTSCNKSTHWHAAYNLYYSCFQFIIGKYNPKIMEALNIMKFNEEQEAIAEHYKSILREREKEQQNINIMIDHKIQGFVTSNTDVDFENIGTDESCLENFLSINAGREIKWLFQDINKYLIIEKYKRILFYSSDLISNTEVWQEVLDLKDSLLSIAKTIVRIGDRIKGTRGIGNECGGIDLESTRVLSQILEMYREIETSEEVYSKERLEALKQEWLGLNDEFDSLVNQPQLLQHNPSETSLGEKIQNNQSKHRKKKQKDKIN